MKKTSNKPIIITTIILLTILVFVLVIFLVAALNGKTGFNLGLINIGTGNNELIIGRTFESENIKKIDIKQDAGKIIFKESPNQNITVEIYGDDENIVDIALNDYTLNIDYTKQKKFALINFGTTENDIIVYIPKKHQVEINLVNDYGECNMIDLENADVNINCSAVDVNLGKIKSATIKCDFGNIKIKEVLNKCKLEADCGNIEIDCISILENSYIKTDMGNVEIDETNDIYINANCDMGSVNINNNNRNSNVELKIESDCGNIDVDN